MDSAEHMILAAKRNFGFDSAKKIQVTPREAAELDCWWSSHGGTVLMIDRKDHWIVVGFKDHV
jgi:hypothetical protein